MEDTSSSHRPSFESILYSRAIFFFDVVDYNMIVFSFSIIIYKSAQVKKGGEVPFAHRAGGGGGGGGGGAGEF